jgi:acyl-CoA thioesterase-2
VPTPEAVDRADQLHQLVDAIHVTSTGPDSFSATPPDWWGPRVFGGMVVAQSLDAALQTADPAQRPHSVHGYFLRPLLPGVPCQLIVEHLRDGRSFALRQVTMEQEHRPAARFMCSFHVDESGDEYQIPMQDVPDPDSLPASTMPGPFDGRDAGPVKALADGAFLSTARLWYRACATLGDEPRVHIGLLTYLSDMTRTSFRPLSLDSWGAHTDASIDHAVWFHRPMRADEWVLSDFQAVVNAGNRSVVRGAMYTRGGVLSMSMTQELLIRPTGEPPQRAPWMTADGEQRPSSPVAEDNDGTSPA